MVLLFRYYINKYFVFTYDFIIEMFCEQNFDVYLWLYDCNISLAKIWCLSMILLVKYFISKNFPFTYAFVIEIFS